MNYFSVPVLGLGEDPVRAGRLEGKRSFIRTLERLPPEPFRVVALDFGGVDLATSSFLSEAVLRLRDHLALGRHQSCLVAVNLAARVEEELDDLLTRSREAMIAADYGDGKLSHGRLIGQLDAKLAETFELVAEHGEATAVELHARTGQHSGIGPTAWNNRLSSLAAMSLLIETTEGRTKRYRTIVEL